MWSLDQDHHKKDQILLCDLDRQKDLQNQRDLWSSDQRSMIFPSSGASVRVQGRAKESELSFREGSSIRAEEALL